MVHRARLILLMAFLLAAGAPSNTNAHGGGLDSLGCHYNRKSGGFHCHQGPLAGQEFRSKAETLEAVKAMYGGSRTRAPVVPPTPTAIVRRASVIDGDTIEIRGARIWPYETETISFEDACNTYRFVAELHGMLQAMLKSDKPGQAIKIRHYGKWMRRISDPAADMMFRMASAISQNPDKEFDVKPPPLEVSYGE